MRKSSDTRTAQVMGVNVMNQASTNVCAPCQGCRHEKILVWLNVDTAGSVPERRHVGFYRSPNFPSSHQTPTGNCCLQHESWGGEGLLHVPNH